MGICESKKNDTEKIITTNNTIISENKIQSINSFKMSKKYSRLGESIIRVSSFEKVDSFIMNKTKSICHFIIETKTEKKIGTGFFLKFNIEQEMFYCLMTNNLFVSDDIINKNDIINIAYDISPGVNIRLETNRRYIKSFKDKGLDITVIEIIDEDRISKDNYLMPYIENRINDQLIDKEIYLLKNQKGEEFKYIRGKISYINHYEFMYSSNNTDSILPGSPIFLDNFDNPIGINKLYPKNHTGNCANFISPVIHIIKQDINQKRNNGKYLNGKYIWNDGKYYIGQFKNNLPNGKGTKYNFNGKILYEGNFTNGKFEGDGKYFFENGDFFIGQYKNGLRNGKGTFYYKNGNIMGKGNFINDLADGQGKYIFEDGNYYEGEWKNGLRNGKGIEYYSNGEIKYEGDYINDKKEGIGKFIFEDGNYYEGEWKNGLKHGKGIEYYSDGKIMYEGDFINGQREGNGKYIWEDGTYYIGQYKNGLKNGKGIEYYSNGNIWYEGDFVNGLREGKGKYIWEDNTFYKGQFKNGLFDGKGSEYYSNGNIEFEGDFVSGKKEGFGKCIFENGDYYIGEWKNDLMHGKGTMYDSNGTIRNKGNWSNDEFVGNSSSFIKNSSLKD